MRSELEATGALSARAVVLVEGISDKVAVETLAKRRVRDLDAEGVFVLPIGGAQAIGGFLKRLGPGGQDVRLAGGLAKESEGEGRLGPSPLPPYRCGSPQNAGKPLFRRASVALCGNCDTTVRPT
jgi:hypothetical protein